MASTGAEMTRSPSTSSSALSNINVAGIADEDSSSENVVASTPPTSLGDNGSVGSATADPIALEPTSEISASSGRRSRRSRAVVNYSIKSLAQSKAPGTSAGSRNVSGLTGRTLIEPDEEQHDGTSFASMLQKVAGVDQEVDAASSRQRGSPARPQRKPSVKDRVKKMAGKVNSVLGKRGSDAISSGSTKLAKPSDVNEKQSRWLKALDMGNGSILEEIDLDALDEMDRGAPSKRRKSQSKTSGTPAATTVKSTLPTAVAANVATGRKGKVWEREGLYVGQEANARTKLQKKRPGSSSSETTTEGVTQPRKRTFMPLPMYDYIDKNTRDFIIPFDIFATRARKGDEKPKDWHQLNRNRLVGEAKDLWEKEDKLDRSLCICQDPLPGGVGCDYDCLNRAMHYECDKDNCGLAPSDCSNRAFGELSRRMKKGGRYDIGVELFKTMDRGFGVRACRTFAPGQIIMEYTGEIISEGECQRRMRELYGGKQSYYLMEFDKGLVIDGTKGSMARFVNHSCEPNCEVRMLKVNGTPRMGVFAGDNGVMTGEELSYDYNFDNFGETKQICYCGAPTCRGTLSRRLNAVEQKLRDREEKEKKRKAEEEAHRNAQNFERKKKAKTDRGANWRGWVPTNEIKDVLKKEKAEREEREKNSVRAQRLAARRQSAPVERLKEAEPRTSSTSRRRTVLAEPESTAATPRVVTKKTKTTDTKDAAPERVAASTQPTKPTHTRTLSSTSVTSKFIEDLPLEPSTALSIAQVLTSSSVHEGDATQVSPEKRPVSRKGGLLGAGTTKSKDVLKRLGGKLKQSTPRF